MAFVDKQGGKHTNHDSMRHANASHMAKMPTKAAPAMEQGEPDGDEPMQGDQPMMTEHHGDGSHTTTHASGKQVHHATAEELVEHLNKHLPEEEAEIQDGDDEQDGY